MQYKTNLRVYLGSHLHFISFEFLCYLSLILGRRRVFLFRSISMREYIQLLAVLKMNVHPFLRTYTSKVLTSVSQSLWFVHFLLFHLFLLRCLLYLPNLSPSNFPWCDAN